MIGEGGEIEIVVPSDLAGGEDLLKNTWWTDSILKSSYTKSLILMQKNNTTHTSIIKQ